MTTKPSESEESQVVTASYANYFEVAHNLFEFLIDIGQIDPCTGQFNIGNRVAVGPTHAKLLARLLDRAVTQYESQYEQIPDIHRDELLDSAMETSQEFERKALEARRRNHS